MEWKTLRVYQGPHKLYEWPGYTRLENFLVIGEDEQIVVRQSPPNPPENESVLVTQEWFFEPRHVLIWQRYINSLLLDVEPYDKAPPREYY